MKRILTLVLTGIMILSSAYVCAEEESAKLPDCLKVVNEKYADSIQKAIEKSRLEINEIDKDNIYIVEYKNASVFSGGADYNQYYVALPLLESEDIMFARFYKGEYQSENINTIAKANIDETYKNTKIEEYIKNNGLENITEAISMRFDVSSASTDVRARINTYKVITATETYYIPYCVYDVHETFNPGNDEGCSFELGKAYTEKDFINLLDLERQAYINYKKAKQEAEKKAEEKKYTPSISVDENGDQIIKVNGTNLDAVLDRLVYNIEQMGFGSSVELGAKDTDEDYIATYIWQSGCSADDVCKFAQGLFDELKAQVTTGKPTSAQSVSYCTFSLTRVENLKSIHHQVKITVWDDGVKIAVNRDDALEFKVKNSDAIINYIKEHSNNNFSGFSYEKNDENTPSIKGSIEGLTKTDIIEFKFVLPADTDNDISKEVASPGNTVNGTFERYKETKYKSTYILTLSGNLGSVSFCEQTQSSLGGEEELFSNNLPVSFMSTKRYENENIVEYKAGKKQTFYKFKMVFKSNDIAEAYFEDTPCFDLKYTQLTDDTKLADEFVEKDKEVILRKAQECANTLYDFGLFKGTDNGYELEKSLTREESATILVRLLGEEDKVDADDFDEVFVDVDKNRWSYAYVMYCYENDITKGTGADTFSPDVQIDANQFITLMLRLLGYTEVNPDTALEKSVEYKLLPEEKIDELTKKKVFTRSDMVQIVYNSLKTQMDDETIFADYLLEKGILTEKEIEQIK